MPDVPAAGTTVSLALTGLRDTDPIGTAALLQQIKERLFGEPGSIELGHYRLLHPIGAGGFGTVYAAHDPRLDRRVAIKLHHPEHPLGASDLLLREAQAMARLSHPNVLTVHDVGTYDLGGGRGGLFVVMELVEGETLQSWLATPRPWPAVVERFAAAGRGLAAAHAIGLVHRDFKPGNVLLGRDGSVRVADFGLAQPVGDSPSARERAGTPLYMAPEQLADGGSVGPAADQFAFCVALFEALFGRQPFPVSDLAERLRAIFARDIAPVPEDSEVPGWLRAAVARGLEAEPEHRHADMHELLRALAPAGAPPGGIDVAAIRARIHPLEPGVIRYHEVPVTSEFTVQVMRAELTRLTIDGAPYTIVVDLDEAHMPGPEVRHHIVRMFADRHLTYVAVVVRGDPVKQLTANLIVSQAVAPERFAMFDSVEAAIAACRAALAAAR